MVFISCFNNASLNNFVSFPNIKSLTCKMLDGSYFVMLLNKSEEKIIKVQLEKQSINMKVPAKTATSFIWKTK